MKKKTLALMLAFVMTFTCTAFAAETDAKSDQSSDEEAIGLFAEDTDPAREEAEAVIIDPGHVITTDPEEPDARESIEVTFNQVTMKAHAKIYPAFIICSGGKLLWSVTVKNNTKTTLENYDLDVPSPAGLKFTAIDPYKTDGDTNTFHIDSLAPGYSMTFPIILIAPENKAPVALDSNGRPKIYKMTYESMATLKPVDSNAPTYTSNTVRLDYITFKTLELK